MAGTYCTTLQVSAFLQRDAFSGSTKPTADQVTEFIEENQDHIDKRTMHAWRSITVTKEQHHLEGSHYQLRDGAPIKLGHRNITTLASGTDLLEVWDGSNYVDYLATKTEGRANDYWVNEQEGIIFLKTYPSFYLPRTFGVRVTYRYGETSVDKDIRKACIRLTAIDIIQSDDKQVVLPQGAEGASYDKKLDKWQEQADKIISDNAEWIATTT